MKIAILGAPGVGKTKLACELAVFLREDTEESWFVLDNYVDDLRTGTGLEYGDFGDFVDDMQVVFKRREWELAWQRSDTNTITVGTVLDSAVQNFARVEEAAKSRKELGIVAERLRAIAATFGLLYTETWDYDYAFLLRSDDVIGRGLIELLTTYRAPVFSFNPEVPDDQKARIAADTIAALEAEQPAPPDERGVRRSGEDGKADGDSSESVPNVPEQGRASDDA